MSWDSVWEEIFKSQDWGKYPEPELIRFIARNFYNVPDRRTIKILEVGCGSGCNLWYCAREGFSVTGVDGSKTAIETAVHRLNQECPGWHIEGEMIIGDIKELPCSDNAFDVVIDNEAIYANSFADSQTIYAEIARVLKPGGRLFSRMFDTETWGYGTGLQIESNTFLVAEGPMKGKGTSRFTRVQDIPTLIGKRFILDPIEWVSRSVDGGLHVIKEWIVTGTKNA